MEVLVTRLLQEGPSEEAWETDRAQIRYGSEGSWEHCNAFSLPMRSPAIARLGRREADGDGERARVSTTLQFPAITTLEN